MQSLSREGGQKVFGQFRCRGGEEGSAQFRGTGYRFPDGTYSFIFCILALRNNTFRFPFYRHAVSHEAMQSASEQAKKPYRNFTMLNSLSKTQAVCVYAAGANGFAGGDYARQLHPRSAGSLARTHMRTMRTWKKKTISETSWLD